MAGFLVIQPNGNYARFSSVLDFYTQINMTQEDYEKLLINSRGLTPRKAIAEAQDVISNHLHDFSEGLSSTILHNIGLKEFFEILYKMCDPVGEFEDLDVLDKKPSESLFQQGYLQFMQQIDTDTIDYVKKHGTEFEGKRCLPLEIYTRLKIEEDFGTKMLNRAFGSYTEKDTVNKIFEENKLPDSEFPDIDDPKQLEMFYKKYSNFGILYDKDGRIQSILNLGLLKDKKKSPLQQKEEKLSLLEEDERVIGAREALVDRENEQNRGE